ncbi:MAG TPA: aminotransferase class IV [Vicinamibacterales bacterium]|nr:aminotransferase class IV [Vicinamibacterales bacterium]
MAAVVNVNGRISGEGEAVVSVFDHGFLYGEGVYETLRTYNQRPFLFDRHTRRLRRSSQMIALHVPRTDEQLASRVRETMDAAQLAGHEAYVRVMLTRGIGALTYDLSATPTPSLIVIVKAHVPPPAEAYAKGVRVAMVSVVRNHPNALNPLIKSNNLMNSALAMQEALRRGGYEGVMRNHRGEIAECTMSNLFVVSKGVALTRERAAWARDRTTAHQLPPRRQSILTG